ncbi:MAG: peptide chain release factor N(5)-glutamine methyltransferase [Spirochaetia bacterium]|jgi:release factor glutamine methyltransferase|nr:peptide chain release factor N(5)-glutamine methyltransferase [Spirochaetia bacterium]
MKTIREVLTDGTSFLRNSNTANETPFLDVLILLAYTLNISKEVLLASYPDKIEEKDENIFNNFLEKRIYGYPVSYIVNTKEFYGLNFYVDENVLIPRPDSETLVEEAITILKEFPTKKKILDLCTGSGALAIALKHSLPELNVICSDLSAEAVEVCKKNCISILGEELLIIEADLFSTIKWKFDMIITNPPYLTDIETDLMMKKNWPEPGMALRAGEDGLDFIRRIITDSPDYMEKNAYLLIESSIDQTESIKLLLDSGKFYNTRIVKDLSGRNRVTIGQRV